MDTMLNLAEVKAAVGLSKSQIYRAMRKGAFPVACKMTEGLRGSVRWKRSEVEAWINSRPRAEGQSATQEAA